MTWRDELRPASFRGVAFETRGHELGGGRRLARHEYPQRDEPYLEDMGGKAREYKVQAFVIGPDYRTARDALLEALEKPGAGELVHPFFGRRSVVAGEYSLRESTAEGGMATFALVFTQAGKLAAPEVGTDAAATLATTQAQAFEAVEEQFVADYDVSGLPGWGLDEITSTVNEFLDSEDFLAIAGSVSAFRAELSGLLLRPSDLAAAIVGLVQSSTRVLSLLDMPYVPVRATRMQPLPTSTATRGKVVQQQAAVNMLFHRAALVQETALLTDLPTRAEVESARQNVVRHFDQHDATPGLLRPSPDLAKALQALQVDTLVHLRRQAAALPQQYALQLLQATPAVVLAYDLYQNLRAGEIVSRNGVRHPGFVPAGVPLEVSSR